MPRNPVRSRGVCAVAGLTLAVALGAGGITGCTGDSTPDPPTRTVAPRPPTAEELAQAAAVARTQALLDQALRTRARKTTGRALLKGILTGHRAQLTALGAPGGTATSPNATATSPNATASPNSTSSPNSTTSPGSTASPNSTTSPDGTASSSTAPSVTLAALARQEYDAARQTLRAVGPVEPGLATLLARQAAALAVNADLLARAAQSPARGILTPAVGLPVGSGTPEASATSTGGTNASGPTSTTDGASEGTSEGKQTSGGTAGTATSGASNGFSTAALESLSQELAGEHAAVYAFALLAGRAQGPAKERALEAYATHLRLRDELEHTLLDAGSDPPVASPAYDVGPLPAGPAGISALASSVETSLASLAAQSVGVTEGMSRDGAASRLVEAARRSAVWTRRPTALPGEGVNPTSEGTGSGSADPTPDPTVGLTPDPTVDPTGTG